MSSKRKSVVVVLKRGDFLFLFLILSFSLTGQKDEFDDVQAIKNQNKIFYNLGAYSITTETFSSPFTIKIFSNFSKEIKKNYKTYLVNNFIKTFKIEDTKVNLIFSSAKNPFN